MTSRIFIVDDDREIGELLKNFLEKNDCVVNVFYSGDGLLETLKKTPPDLLVLDLMLPGIDGFSLCKKIREFSNLPIIMLTAINESPERTMGLEMGLDDYVTKPFNPRELLARIRAVLRRASWTSSNPANKTPSIFMFSGWTLHASTHRLLDPDGAEITLSTGEFDLLLLFLQNAQKTLSRDFLMERAKNREANPFDRTMDVQISRLRQKLEKNPKNPELILTIRSEGYLFTAPVSTKAEDIQ